MNALGLETHVAADQEVIRVAVRLCAETKGHRVLIMELLFADYAILTTQAEGALQRLIMRFAEASKECGLT
ncbi:hypothetical protein RRG08_016349 [Elysia crispata]|uniref:Uncharacterized protein n=1 Tax=Elysia crispata TaxID=231223 RepID=A0AAE0Z0H9_9GAST|nr:hypothetical protein RRG08_016349 [Elysia crispata]